MGQRTGERRVLFLLEFLEETLLLCLHVLAHRFLGVPLHTGVDGGVDLQTILIDVVLGAIRFLVLLAESVKRIVVPLVRIYFVLLFVPLRIIALFGLFGGKHTTQIFAEIGCASLFMIHRAVVQLKRQGREGVSCCLVYVAVFLHLAQDRVSTTGSAFRMTHGVIERRVLTHADQHRRFLYLEVGRRGGEIDLRSRLDTHGIVQKIKLVEVHQQNLVLGIEPFEFGSDDPFYWFLHSTLEDVIRTRRPQLLRQLLGEGRTTTGTSEFEHSAEHRFEIHARMTIETRVLGSYQRMDDIRREIRILHTYSVLVPVIASQGLHVGRDDLRGIGVLRVLQLLQGRQVTQHTLGNEPKDQPNQQNASYKETPKPNQKRFVPIFRFHIIKSSIILFNTCSPFCVATNRPSSVSRKSWYSSVILVTTS